MYRGRPETRASVGIRDLKNRLSDVLRRVRGGETIAVTDRNRPVALLVPLRPKPTERTLRQLVEAGRLSWAGGKPVGATNPPTVRGAPVSDAVIEDRR
jgi:prevent-host-death family protein